MILGMSLAYVMCALADIVIRLRLVANLSTNAVRVPIKDYADLQDWIHESEKLALVGQAAHPFPVSCRCSRTSSVR